MATCRMRIKNSRKIVSFALGVEMYGFVRDSPTTVYVYSCMLRNVCALYLYSGGNCAVALLLFDDFFSNSWQSGITRRRVSHHHVDTPTRSSRCQVVSNYSVTVPHTAAAARSYICLRNPASRDRLNTRVTQNSRRRAAAILRIATISAALPV